MTKGRSTTYEKRIALVREFIEKGYNYGEIVKKYKVGYQKIYTWDMGQEIQRKRRSSFKRSPWPAQERLRSADRRGTA